LLQRDRDERGGTRNWRSGEGRPQTTFVQGAPSIPRYATVRDVDILRYRRMRGDMIEVYNILTNKYDTNINFSFEKQQDSRTRGHNLKLVSHRHHYYLRKYSFTARIVNTWNSLPESVIAAETTNRFKNRLDKFWNNQEMIFDYKAELTGIGNRSNIL